jgi:hypothetical protein
MKAICERVPGAGRSYGGHRVSGGDFVPVDQEVAAVCVQLMFEDGSLYQFGLTRDECRDLAGRLNEAALDG